MRTCTTMRNNEKTETCAPMSPSKVSVGCCSHNRILYKCFRHQEEEEKKESSALDVGFTHSRLELNPTRAVLKAAIILLSKLEWMIKYITTPVIDADTKTS